MKQMGHQYGSRVMGIQARAMSKRRNLWVDLGIVLAIAGVSCMGIVKGLLDSNVRILSTLVVILSVVLLSRGSSLGYIELPTEDAGCIFAYGILTLVLALTSGTPLMANGYGFIFQAAGFVQLFLLWNIDFESNLDSYVEVGFWFCGVFSLITLLLLLKKTGGALFANDIISEDGETLFNRSTIGAIGFKSFVMVLAYQPQTHWKTMVRRVFLILAITVLIASTRRGGYMGAIVACVLHYRNCREHGGEVDLDKAIKKVLSVVFCIVLILVLYANNSFIRETFGRAGESLFKGIRTFLGLDSSDMAVSMRTSSAKRVIDQYLHNSTAKQVLLGRGYMTTWVDVPIVQAFWDLGLLGGIFFIVIQFIIPVRYLAQKAETQGIRAAQYLTAMSMMEGVMSGYPYGKSFECLLLIKICTAHELEKRRKSNQQTRMGKQI